MRNYTLHVDRSQKQLFLFPAREHSSSFTCCYRRYTLLEAQLMSDNSLETMMGGRIQARFPWQVTQN